MQSRRFDLKGRISGLIFICLLVTLAASQLITSSSNLSTDNGQHDENLLMEISDTCKYVPEDFKSMGDSVDRALRFYELNVDKLVLDAAVGTRVVQGMFAFFIRN